MINDIDRFVLDRVERVARFLQLTFGIHPISIAAAGNIIFGACMILRLTVLDESVGLARKVLGWIVVSYVILATTFGLPQLRSELDHNAIRGLSNPRKISGFGMMMRVAILALFPITALIFVVDPDAEGFLVLMMWLGLFLHLYFTAVDPSPPGVSRFRKWLDSFAAKRATAPQ